VAELINPFFLATAIRLAAPMFLAAIGETVTERGGIFNVGIEGMMLVGAFVGVVGVVLSGDPLVGLVLATSVGAAVGLVYGIIIAGFRADQVVAGIGLNILAIGATSFLRSLWLGSRIESVPAGALQDRSLPFLGNIPYIGAALFTQSPVVYLSYLLIPVTAFFLFRTRPGLVVRSVGEHAGAADAAGVDVVLTRVYALMFAGAMAGMAGAYLSIVQTSGVFIDNMTNGRGFLAIAITIFGRWHPLKIAAAALLFGGAEALQFRGQVLFGQDVPPALLFMFPFVLALLAWVALGRGQSGPADLGRPFLRSEA
jgi:simple sugar transport system permease protein